MTNMEKQDDRVKESLAARKKFQEMSAIALKAKKCLVEAQGPLKKRTVRKDKILAQNKLKEARAYHTNVVNATVLSQKVHEQIASSLAKEVESILEGAGHFLIPDHAFNAVKEKEARIVATFKGKKKMKKLSCAKKSREEIPVEQESLGKEFMQNLRDRKCRTGIVSEEEKQAIRNAKKALCNETKGHCTFPDQCDIESLEWLQSEKEWMVFMGNKMKEACDQLVKEHKTLSPLPFDAVTALRHFSEIWKALAFPSSILENVWKNIRLGKR